MTTAAAETIDLPMADYRNLLDCTVGVDAYRRAARNGALTGEAHAAARQAVDEAIGRKLRRD